jgi:hypothetical protein
MHLLVPEVYIEQFGIAKVVMHLLMPDVYIEQFGITKAVIHLLVLGVYIEQFGITKFGIHLLGPGCLYRTDLYNKAFHTPTCVRCLYLTVRYN